MKSLFCEFKLSTLLSIQGDPVRGISVVNAALSSDPKYDPLLSPYSRLRRGHPLSGVDCVPLVLSCANVQRNGPAYGNVAFKMKVPVNLILQEKMRLFYVEFQGADLSF